MESSGLAFGKPKDKLSETHHAVACVTRDGFRFAQPILRIPANKSPKSELTPHGEVET